MTRDIALLAACVTPYVVICGVGRMQLSGGDDIALSAVILSACGFMVREWRAKITKTAMDSAAETSMRSLVSAIETKLDDLMKNFAGLMHKAQQHELDCAVIRERTASEQRRTAEILKGYGRDIGQLQGQIRHVATGAAGKIIELPAIKDG